MHTNTTLGVWALLGRCVWASTASPLLYSPLNYLARAFDGVRRLAASQASSYPFFCIKPHAAQQSTAHTRHTRHTTLLLITLLLL
uniref:Putative secreted protein n=1 Tax=Anopheles darlingi TaxID=43151 RepID=A0A2M4D8B6_ANODA